MAVTGATDQLGCLAIEKLKTLMPAGQITALVRSPEKAADLGVEARLFDCDQPETLLPALTSVDKLSADLIQRYRQTRGPAPGRDRRSQAGGCRRNCLYQLSARRYFADVLNRQTEDALARSGIPHTILRSGWYAENYTGNLQAAIDNGALIGAAEDGRISAAVRADYTEAAAVVLAGDGHASKTCELAGDTAWTLEDLAAEVSAQTGWQIPYRNLSESDHAQALAGMGLPKDMTAAIGGFDADAGKGALLDDGGQLSALIGRPTASLADVVSAAL